jgi:hypothetical protein
MRDRTRPNQPVHEEAWSGTGPVTEVHVSLTGEGDWHPAQLEPPKGPYQWQDWSYDWAATAAGRHTLRACATDAAGNTNPTFHLGIGSATETTPLRSATSTCADAATANSRRVKDLDEVEWPGAVQHAGADPAGRPSGWH